MKQCFIYLLLFIYTTSSFNAKAQTGSGWEWASTTGNANATKGIRALTTDVLGNVYVTGGYYDSLTLGGTTYTGTPASANHGFVAKYDKLGNVLWVTPVNYGLASTIAIDADGNSYIGGNDRSSTTSNIGFSFAAKYDNNGNNVWYKIFTLNEIIAINVGPDGNPIAIDEIPGSRNIYKLNKTDGNIIWTVTNTGSSIPTDAATSYSSFLDAAGNVYYSLYGFLFGGANVPETIAGQNFINSSTTAFFVSLDNNGNKRWIDSAAGVQAGKITVTKTGKVYLFLNTSTQSGGFGGTNQPVSTALAYNELDSLGRTTYKSIRAPFQGYTGGKLIVKDDGVYTNTTLTGGSAYTTKYGDYSFTAPVSNTTNLNVIVKYDPTTYKVIWANSFETTGDAYFAGGIIALDVTATGKVVVGGSYGKTVKFGSILKNAVITATNPYTKTDLFLAQFDGANVALPPSTTWTGAANNMNFNDAANWTNGVPNAFKTIIPSGLSNYPNNITIAARIGKLEVGVGATIILPLDINIPNGIINNGSIELTEAGIFYGGFNTGQTLITGTGKIVMKNIGTYYFGNVILDNSLEINCTGTVTSFGGTITGSLILTSGVYSGDIILNNPNASVTASSTSYVMGKLTRSVNASGSYNFPIAYGTRYAPVTLQLNGITGTKTIAVSFNNALTGNAPNTMAQGVSVTSLLNSGIWTITPDVALTGGSYNVTLEGRGFTNSVTDATRYVVLKRANASSDWAFFGNNGVSTYTATTITTTAGNITGFSDFAIGIASATVPITLPVTYTYFIAEKSNAQALLKWQTAQEINNNYFNVQQSTNAFDWATIGKVSAANSVGVNNYYFNHAKPFNGVNYYRLQQVDKDGKSSFSDVRRVDMGAAKSNLKLYPNPSIGNLVTIDYGTQITKPLTYKIIDVAGRLMQAGDFTNQQQTINLQQLSIGNYSLLISDGQVIKLIKM